MSALIEEAIRWIGYLVLRVMTLGWYRGGKESDRLAEGAFGFMAVAVVSYVALKFR